MDYPHKKIKNNETNNKNKRLEEKTKRKRTTYFENQ